MPDLNFVIEKVFPVVHAAAPLLSFKIRIVSSQVDRIHALVLDCKIQVEALPNPPAKFVRDHLEELFGEPSEWAESSHAMPWARASAVVPAFSGGTRCEIEVPCSFDFNVAATKYFYGLEAASAPLQFEFTGTVFTDLRASSIAPAKQVRFALPMRVWSDLMDAHYPESMWLRLPRRVFQRLSRYKAENRIPNWEDVLERLLPASQEAVH